MVKADANTIDVRDLFRGVGGKGSTLPNYAVSPLGNCPQAGNIIGIQPWVNTMEKRVKEFKQSKMRKPLKLITPWERIERRAKKRDECNGDKILERFYEALNALEEQGFKRTPIQNEMMTAYLGACMRVVYQQDFADRVTEILERLGVKELKQEIFVTAIRRCGKTYSVAMFVAAALYAIPEVEISIFSTGRRASKKLLHTIKRFVEMLPNMENTERSANEETMWIQGSEGPLDKRVVNSYPSKVQIENLNAYSPHPCPVFSCLFVCLMRMHVRV